jgi:hypothetical protein
MCYTVSCVSSQNAWYLVRIITDSRLRAQLAIEGINMEYERHCDRSEDEHDKYVKSIFQKEHKDIFSRKKLTNDAVMLYNKMDSMLVDGRTQLHSVIKFLKKSGHSSGNNFYGTCIICKQVQLGAMIRCGNCAETFCKTCACDGMYSYETTFFNCPRCLACTKSQCLLRFVSWPFVVESSILSETQLWHSNHTIVDKRCWGCSKDGCMHTCSCVFGARYCSADCQEKDWPNHKNVCTVLNRNNGSVKIREYIDDRKDDGCVHIHVPANRFDGVDLSLHPLSVLLMMNAAKARNADASMKLERIRNAVEDAKERTNKV